MSSRPMLASNATPEEGIAYALAEGEWRIKVLTDLLTCLLHEGHLRFDVLGRHRDQGALVGESDTPHYLTQDEESIVREILEGLVDPGDFQP